MPNAPASPPALSTPGHEPDPEPELIDHTQARLAPCPICKFKNRYMPSDKGVMTYGLKCTRRLNCSPPRAR